MRWIKLVIICDEIWNEKIKIFRTKRISLLHVQFDRKQIMKVDLS